MLLAFGTHTDHSVPRILGPNIFQVESNLIIPVVPVNSSMFISERCARQLTFYVANQFANTLRNPMIDSERAKDEATELVDPSLRVEREKSTPIYITFYPSITDPTRAIDPLTGEPFPVGANPTNPYEVDFTCSGAGIPLLDD